LKAVPCTAIARLAAICASSRIDRELAMNALLMAVWRRQPKNTVMVHPDQGSQFSSYDWRDFLDAHDLQQSMSRRKTVTITQLLKASSSQ
jgi:transposase InsO family protein